MYSDLDIQNLVSDVKQGKAKMHHLDREVGVDEAIKTRQRIVKELTDSSLEKIADFYDEEVDYGLSKLAESIEPILIFAMGIMVLILALGVFLPICDLGKAALG